MIKRFLFIVFGILGAYMLLWPNDVTPVAWTPDPVLDLPGNNLLAGVQRIELAEGHGPEDVAITEDGFAYTGLHDGRIIEVNLASGAQRELVNTGGRPLGLDLDADGDLIVADTERGLLRVSMNGEVKSLTAAANGRPFKVTDDVDVGADGFIYFSDASDRYPVSHFKLDILEHHGNGRLLRYDPERETTLTLMDGLSFANGVAVSPDAEFVLVVESGENRVHRYWLSGERAGQSEIFVSGLPGFPDGISSNGEGLYWLTLATSRSLILDLLADWPEIRKVLSRLPISLYPPAKRVSHVLGLNAKGEIKRNLYQADGEPLAFITSAEQSGANLYLGSLEESAFGVFSLSQPRDE